MKKKLMAILIALCSAFATVGFASCDILSKLPDPDDYENVATYTVKLDSKDFNPVQVYNADFDCTGLTLYYSQELNGEVFYETTIGVRPDMITKGGKTDSVGDKSVTITYHDETWTIDYTVKYQVDFLAYGKAFDTQYVMNASEIVVPDPTAQEKDGYVFAFWKSEIPETLSGNLSIEGHYYDTKLVVPSLSALDRVYDPNATLKDIELPSTEGVGKWEFVDALTTPVGGAGTHEFDVRFVPATDELAPVANSKVTINVSKQLVDKPTISENVFTYDGTAKAVLEGAFELFTVSNNVQTNAGAYTVGLALKDTANYAWSTKNPDPTFTIEPKKVTFEIGEENFLYDGKAHFPAFEASEDIEITVSLAPQTNAGTYKYELSIKDKNYTGGYKGSFTIAKKAVEFTVTETSFVYDGEEHFPKYTVSDPTAPISVSGSARVEAGEYSFRLSVSDSNYSGSYRGSFEITKPDIEITVDSDEITYGEEIPEITYTVTGFTGDLAHLNIQTVKPSNDGAGVHTITVTVNNENVNVVKITSGTLTIHKANLGSVLDPVLSTDSKAAIYEDLLSSVTFESAPLGTWLWKEPDTVIDNMNGITVTAVFVSQNSNFNPYEMPLTITNIAKRELAIEVTENSYTYTGEAFAVEYVIKDVAIEGLTYTENEKLQISGNDSVINAGTYDRKLEIVSDCYKGSISTKLKIDQATPEVELSNTSATVTWKQFMKLNNTGITLSGSGAGSYDWKYPTTDVYTLEIGKATSFKVVFTPDDTLNYTTREFDFTLTVEKAATQIKDIATTTFVYSGNAVTISADVDRDIEKTNIITYEFKKDGVTVDSIVNVGEYTVIITAAETAHYVSATKEVLVTVTQATNTWSQTPYMTKSEWDYSTTAGEAKASAKFGSVVITYTGAGYNSATMPTNAGSYQAIFTVAGTADYTGLTKTVDFKITKANVTKPTLAENSFVYTGKAPTISVKDSADSAGKYTFTQPNQTDVGTGYTVTLTLKSEYSANYVWADTKAAATTLSFNITKATISLSTWKNTSGWAFGEDVNLPYVEATRSNGGNYAVDIVYSYATSYYGTYTEIEEDTFTSASNAGTYYIKASVVSTDNYVGVSTQPQAFTIHTTAVDMNGVTKEYGITWFEGLKLSNITPTGTGAGSYAWVVEGSTAENTALNAETYTNFKVRYTPADPNYHAIEVAVTVYVSHKPIDIPTSVTLTDGVSTVNGNPVYNGNAWSCAETAADYTISSTSATNAGETVKVTFTLKANRVWKDDTTAAKTLTYTVQKADNKDSVQEKQTAIYGDRLSKLTLPTSTLGTWKWKEGSNTAVGDVTAIGEPHTFHAVFTPNAENANNYNPREVEVEVTVVKKAVTHPTLAQSSFVYTGTAPTLTIVDKGNSVGMYNAIVQPTETEVGTYTVELTLKEETFFNYEWATATNVSDDGKKLTLTFEITKATPTITWTTVGGGTYGGTITAATATTNFGTISGYTYSTEDGKVPTKAGTYTVTATVAESDNWTSASAETTFVVEKAKVDVPQNPASVSYTGVAQTATINETALYNSATISGTIVGEYTVALTLKDGNNYEWADGEGKVTFTITPATAEQIALSVSVANDGWTYAQTPSEVSAEAKINGNTIANASISYVYYDADMGSLGNAKPGSYSNAGVYYVKAILAGTNNYESKTSELVKFTIAQATHNVVVPSDLKATYGALLSSVSLGGDTMGTWSWENETETVGDAGTQTHYVVYTYTNAADAINYKAIAKQAVEITVAKKTLTVNFDTQTFVYNGENQKNNISYTIKDGETVYTDLNASVSVQQSGAPVEFKNAGSYTVTVTINENNYAGSASKTLTIGQATPTVSVSLAGWTYGAPNAPQTTTSNTDGGYTVTYTYSTEENGTYATVTDFGALNAGTYYVKATVSATDNYVEMTSAAAMFTIAKAAVEVPEIASKSYTGATLTADVSASTLYEVTTNAGGINVGEYDVALKLTNSTNYEWSTTDEATITLKFEITKAELTLTKVDIVGWTYGAAVKVPGITVKDNVIYNSEDVVYVYYDSATNTSVPLSTVENADNNYANYMKALNAGTYSMQVYVKATDNYAESNYLNTTVVVSKAKVSVPEIESKEYTGYEQDSNLTNTDDYIVVSDMGGTDKGTYSVILELNDYTNYEWSIPENYNEDNTATVKLNRVTITYKIVTALNKWKEGKEPNITEEWTYGESGTVTMPEAKFGEGTDPYHVQIFWSGTTYAGTSYSANGQDGMPTDAGEYTITFKVAGNGEEWSELTETISFIIKKATVKVDDITGSEETDLSKSYTGATLTADVKVLKDAESNALYTVVNNGGKNFGGYDVILTLVYSYNYKWSTDTDVIGKETTTKLTFSITKATTTLSKPTIQGGWEYLKYNAETNKATSTPNVEVKEIIYTYYDENNVVVEDISTAKVGWYTVVASVEGTDDYTEVTSEPTEFSIIKANIANPNLKVSATYEDTLGNIEVVWPNADLGSWSWKDGDATSVGDATDSAGREFMAVFTPDQNHTKNYNSIEFPVTVVVNQKQLEFVIDETQYFEYNKLDQIADIDYTLKEVGGDETVYTELGESISVKHNVKGDTEFKNAGDYTVTLSLIHDNYVATTKTCTLKMSQAKNQHVKRVGASNNSTFTLTATYYQKLADIESQFTEYNTADKGTWSWVQDKNDLVGDVGQRTHVAKFTPNDTANYESYSSVIVTVNVEAKEIGVPTITLTDTAGNSVVNADPNYTGKEWSITVTPKETGDATHYGVTSTSATNALTSLSVTLTLNENCVWDDNGAQVRTFTYTIQKAKNNITTLKVDNWTYGQAANTPTLDADNTVGAVYYYKSTTATTDTWIKWTDKIPTQADDYYLAVDIPESDNYSKVEKYTVEGYKFTISKKAIPVPTPTPASVAYTGAEQSVTIDAFTYNNETVYKSITISGKEVKTYTKALTLENNDNYEWESGNGTVEFTITPATAEQITLSVSGGWTYNKNGTYNISAEAKIGENLLTDAAFTYAYYTENTAEAEPLDERPSNAGTYYVKATLGVTGNYASKTSDFVKFTIESKKLSVSFTDPKKTYNGSAHFDPDVLLEATGDNANGYTVDIEGVRHDGTTEITTGIGTEAGKYTITLTLNNPEGVANYVWETNDNVVNGNKVFTYTINKATVTAELAANQSFTYNGSEQTANVIVTANNGATLTLGDDNDKKDYTLSGNKQTDADTYDITVTLSDTDNYMWPEDVSTMAECTLGDVFIIGQATPTVRVTQITVEQWNPYLTFGTIINDKGKYPLQGTATSQFTLPNGEKEEVAGDLNWGTIDANKNVIYDDVNGVTYETSTSLNATTYQFNVTFTPGEGFNTNYKSTVGTVIVVVNPMKVETPSLAIQNAIQNEGDDPNTTTEDPTYKGKPWIPVQTDTQDYTVTYTDNVVNAGQTITITFTLKQDNEQGIINRVWNNFTGSVSYTVQQVKNEQTIATLTATYGQTLADIASQFTTYNTADGKGTWSWETPDTTKVGDVGNRTHKAKYTPNDTTNYESRTVEVTVNVSAKVISVSFEDPKKTYNGSAHFDPDVLLKATGVNAGGYTVDIEGVRHDGTTEITTGIGTEAGEYTITLTLNNPEGVANYVWETNDNVVNGNKVFTYTINKATITLGTEIEGVWKENVWANGVLTDEGWKYGWTYGETEKLPVIAVKRSGGGNYTVPIVSTYTDSEGNTVNDFTSTTNAGGYYVKATVANTDNYDGATANTAFTIEKATLTIVGATYESGAEYYENQQDKWWTVAGDAAPYAVSDVTNNKVAGVFTYDYDLSEYKFDGSALTVNWTFVPNDTTNYTYTNGANQTFEIAFKAVAYINSTYYGTIEKALEMAAAPVAQGGFGANATTAITVWVIPDATGNVVITKDTTIPQYVTLCLPYEGEEWDTSDASKRNNAVISDFADANEAVNRKAWVKLDQNVTLTVNGTLNIGGVLSQASQIPSGHTSGAYAEILLGKGATIESNGTINCYGFIKEEVEGTGAVNINQGTLTMPFVVYDYRGGSNTVGVFKAGNIMPFNVFDMPNIHSILNVTAGAIVYGSADLWTPATSVTEAQHNVTTVNIVGSTSADALIMLHDGAIATFDYDPGDRGYTNNQGTTSIVIDGGASLGELLLKIELGEIASIQIPTQIVQTGNIFFAVSWKYNIHLNGAGSEYNIDHPIKFMSGSTLTVGEGATLNVNSEMIMYPPSIDSTLSAQDKDRDNTFCDDTSVGEGRYPGGKDAARFITFGTVNINSTGAFGGIIEVGIPEEGEPRAKVVVDPNATLSVTSKEGQGSMDMDVAKNYVMNNLFGVLGGIDSLLQEAINRSTSFTAKDIIKQSLKLESFVEGEYISGAGTYNPVERKDEWGNGTGAYGWFSDKLTISYDSNGGSEVADVEDDCPETGYEIKASHISTRPTRDHYTFTHWCWNDDCTNGSNCNNKVNAGEIIYGSAIFYASWTADEYNINYVYVASNGTTTTASGKFSMENPISLNEPEIVTTEFFKGWYTAADGKTKLETISTKAYADLAKGYIENNQNTVVTLYALYSADPVYKIIYQVYKPDDVTLEIQGSATLETTSETEQFIPVNQTTGNVLFTTIYDDKTTYMYYFDGWYIDSSFETKFNGTDENGWKELYDLIPEGEYEAKLYGRWVKKYVLTVNAVLNNDNDEEGFQKVSLEHGTKYYADFNELAEVLASYDAALTVNDLTVTVSKYYAGWDTDGDGVANGMTLDASMFGENKELTINAIWADKHKVTISTTGADVNTITINGGTTNYNALTTLYLNNNDTITIKATSQTASYWALITSHTSTINIKSSDSTHKEANATKSPGDFAKASVTSDPYSITSDTTIKITGS